MNRKRRFACLSGFLLLCVAAIGQNFGGNPGNIKWQKVNTSKATIIFPKGMDSLAFRVASLTERLGEKQYSSTIGDQYKKVPIVLQPNNTLSNAYVQLAPWRSEFYLTPPQNPFELGSLRWADNLAIHEYRHVEQYANFNVGLSKFFSVLLGQQGRAFANAVAVPDWFFEGDAVWKETVYSRQGRGRLPDNFNAFKSLFFSDKHYSYMKLRNGSMKDFVPNHYDLGYLLVAYGREKYGDDIWQKISRDAAAFKGLFYPWQKAVLRHTGIAHKQFVSDAMKWYEDKWQAEKIAEPDWITRLVKKDVVNYRYPYPTDNGGMVYVKSSFTQVPAFMLRHPNGVEEKIDGRDITYDTYFSYKKGKIIYTSTRSDVRWDNRDYSDVRILDVSSGKIVTVSRRAKYFSPDLNDDADRIVVVDADPTKTCVLKMLDATGTVLKSWTANPGYFYSHPKFIDNGQHVVVAARQANGDMGWMRWNTQTNEWLWLLEPANRLIGYPVIKKDTLYYSGSAGTVDALYAISLSQKSSPVLVAKYQTGIYQGYFQDGKIIASTITSEGYRLGAFIPVQQQHAGLLEDLYVSQTLSKKEDVLQSTPKAYPVKKYSKLTNPFNFHSWQAELSDPDYTVSLLGENVLSSLLSDFYYTYNRNERSNKIGFTGVYGGTFVQPVLGASQTWGREVALNEDTTLIYNQFEGNAGLQLPLNFNFGKMYRSLLLYAAVNKQTVRWTDFAKGRYNDADFDYYRLRLTYTSQIQKSVRQINPRFAQSYLIDYRSIFNTYTAWQWLLSGSVYAPGFYKTHSIVLSAAWHARDTMNQYVFSSSFPFSRGYSAVNYPRMYKVGINYHFPLFYPDWGFGQMVYFLRVRANAFYDFTQGKSLRTSQKRNFRSVGGEIYFDTKWWNQQAITFGFRYARLLDSEYSGATNPNFFEFILPVNLLPR